VGLNGLYLNLRGREAEGIVDPRDREGLLQEIGRALLGVVDPATGSAAVTRVYRPEASYRGREFLTLGPDLIVGYAKGTRCSNESALGGASGPVLADNTDPWSGDHCMDHAAVPGVLLSNRPLVRPVTALQQLGGAILAEFGIDEFPEAE
jgi:predicted AlkP superfamily phosphohydrolase/phosphomutase